MAERLNTYTFRNRGRLSPYDWDSWLDGSAWKLVRGTDFAVSAESIRRLAGIQARKRGGKVRTSIIDDDSVVVIQFYTTNGAA